jgi:sialic acid synthase SpsE/mannose-6-phosphate isomerase-like protein (cupin superfamily)
MANNHFGDVGHGVRIIREIKKECASFPYKLGFKFQYRHLDSYIHKEYAGSEDKQVKRFSETKLSVNEFLTLKKEASDNGFVTICTPFDEESVEMIVKHNYDIIKIASCSFTDWPLLEKVAATDKPIIASVAGSSIEDIDRVVSFFEHRRKDFCLMHCVGEYPTDNKRLQLNQIDLLKHRYPDVLIGFSTHELPNNFDSIKIAVAKGSTTFERHVGIDSEKYPLNAYSSKPDQIRMWLDAASDAMEMCGIYGERYESTEDEMRSLRGFRRGVFAKNQINVGEELTDSNVYFAFPNIEGQLLANNIGKYDQYVATEIIGVDKPIISSSLEKTNSRQQIADIVGRLHKIIAESNVVIPNEMDLELSHHYGLDSFLEFGLSMLTLINREYSKKVIIILPGQKNPIHYHKKKEETFFILHGDFIINIDGIEKKLEKGQMLTVDRGVKHSLASENGCILEEISTTHYHDDSFYDDDGITNKENRKTHFKFWIDRINKDVL